MNNLISIPAKKLQVQPALGSHFVASIMLSNPMSLTPKLCEVKELLLRQNVQIGCFVETWLKEHIILATRL